MILAFAIALLGAAVLAALDRAASRQPRSDP